MANKKSFPLFRLLARSLHWCQELVRSVEYRALGVFSWLFPVLGLALGFRTPDLRGPGFAAELFVFTSQWSCFFSEPTRTHSVLKRFSISTFLMSEMFWFSDYGRPHLAPGPIWLHYVYELLISFLLISQPAFCSLYNGRPFGTKCLLKMI